VSFTTNSTPFRALILCVFVVAVVGVVTRSDVGGVFVVVFMVVVVVIVVDVGFCICVVFSKDCVVCDGKCDD